MANVSSLFSLLLLKSTFSRLYYYFVPLFFPFLSPFWLPLIPIPPFHFECIICDRPVSSGLEKAK